MVHAPHIFCNCQQSIFQISFDSLEYNPNKQTENAKVEQDKGVTAYTQNTQMRNEILSN